MQKIFSNINGLKSSIGSLALLLWMFFSAIWHDIPQSDIANVLKTIFDILDITFTYAGSVMLALWGIHQWIKKYFPNCRLNNVLTWLDK